MTVPTVTAKGLAANVALAHADLGALGVQLANAGGLAASEADRAVRPQARFDEFQSGGFIVELVGGENGLRHDGLLCPGTYPPSLGKSSITLPGAPLLRTTFSSAWARLASDATSSSSRLVSATPAPGALVFLVPRFMQNAPPPGCVRWLGQSAPRRAIRFGYRQRLVGSPPLDWVQKLDSGKPVRENHIVHCWLLPPPAGLSQLSMGFAIRAFCLVRRLGLVFRSGCDHQRSSYDARLLAHLNCDRLRYI
jgi:hypothetical protein